jgi:4-amino-4-deoxy-L-arabinose transferase-like glycosyltransferase
MKEVGSVQTGNRFLRAAVAKVFGSKKPCYRTFAVVILLMVAAALRLYHIDNLHTVEPDERLWLEAGTSLITEGVPTSWTIRWPSHNWEAYDRVEGGTVTPWLDHPPLYSLMIGGWALLVGQDDFAQLSWGLLRLPMALISVATILFTYLFVSKVFGKQIAMFTLLAFVFFPSEIVASRFTLAENVIPLFSVLGLYALAVYLSATSREVRRLSLATVLLVSFAAPLLKLSGAVVPLTIVLFLVLTKRYRLGMKVAGVGILSLASFLLYAWSYSWDVFVGAQRSHMIREHSFVHFWTLFTELDVGNYTLVDPSIIVGFIGLLAIMLLEPIRERRLYIFSAVFVLSFLLLYISPVEAYMWYKYPLYPLLAIGLGYVFFGLYKERAAYLILFLPMMGMMLQHSLLFDNQSSRKLALVFFYGMSTFPLVTDNRVIRLKHVFIVLLVIMLLFQVVWIEWAARCITPCS